jgi:predicted membrane-bound mannosyltransferase
METYQVVAAVGAVVALVLWLMRRRARLNRDQ